jgi:hypothetical protein
MAQNNLDYLCAKYGHKIVKKAEKKKEMKNLIQKSLGILQEDGVYAFVVYLDSEGAFKGEKVAEKILSETFNLLKEDGIKLVKGNYGEEELYKQIQKLSENIDNLFLAKDLIERTLIYARYHAKAL